MSADRILITGAEGFIGSTLLYSLGSRGFNISAAQLELQDGGTVSKAISGSPCDTLIHLAAISHVPTCERDPAKAYQVNLGGTALVLDALAQHQPGTHLIFASTAQIYSAPSVEEAASQAVFDETRAIAPQNTYARTKWACELLIQDAVARRGLSATILRLFNHSHKSQSPDFFLPHLYSVMSQGKQGEPMKVPVGNLDLYRDIGSRRDLLAAFEALLQANRPAAGVCRVFNVCSGAPKHLGKLAQALAAGLGLQASFETDPSRVRPGEARVIVGSHERMTAATGWRPSCVTEQDLIAQFLE